MNPPRIYSCAEWGARPPAHPLEASQPGHVVIHHMDWPNRALASDPDQARKLAFDVARACQRDHMDDQGWADTGQSFTVTRDGLILEGRHGSLEAARQGRAVRGAHASDGVHDYNDDFGIENEGTYDLVAMPPQQWQALVALTAWLCHQCGIDTQKVLGHRDTGIATDCPGGWLESRLPALRQQAHALKLAYEAS